MAMAKSKLKPILSKQNAVRQSGRPKPIAKAPTGITGFDAITFGGLPRGRPTLVCGGPGCGKTLFALHFLIRGALDYGEPGLYVAFEETELEIMQNVASLGYDLQDLVDRGLLLIEYIHVERTEIEESGEYDLEGLFIRLGLAIDTIGAKRVALDTLEVLFIGFSNLGLLRAEIRRLFRWLKQRNVTVVVTGERGEGSLTRHGLEEYVSDCVILLDHRVVDQVSTRRIRVVKYRGSPHGTNEYPFLIDASGLSVLPITAIGLQHTASTERVSSGVPALDAMLGGAGYYRGSSILISGTAGAGKSSLAAHFVDAAGRRGQRCLYFAFEESQSQIVRNMRSIGIDLERHVDQGLLRFHAVRPTHYGLEMHLAVMHRAIEAFEPQVVVIDPVTNLVTTGTAGEVRSTLTRLIDYLKTKQITALYTSLTTEGQFLDHTDVAISSLIDTWLGVRMLDIGGERNRGLQIIKSRGMAHSNQLREFRLTDHGVELVDVYTGPGGVLTGAARAAQETQEQAQALRESQELDRQRRKLERQRAALEAQIAALRAGFEAESEEAQYLLNELLHREQVVADNRSAMARRRGAADGPSGKTKDSNGQPKTRAGRSVTRKKVE
jgi:circadian clock protein KaiC